MTDSRKCTAITDAGRACRAWAVHGTEPALCPAHAGYTNGDAPVNGNGNGHGLHVEAAAALGRIYGNEHDAPFILRSLADEELPFNELAEILLAFRVAGEVTADALAFFDNVVDDGGIFEQMREAELIRRYYVERLQNLHGRIRKGHLQTLMHLMGRHAEAVE